MSQFIEALDRGDLLTGELTPPRGTDPSALLNHAREWVGSVDAAHLNDCLLATARMSNLAAAALMRETGLEAVMQLTLRHRNRIALQAELLGAHAVGVRGLLLLSGYQIRIGSDPEARESGDLHSSRAIALTRRLSDGGRLFNGDDLPEAPHFRVGAVETIGPGPPAGQVARVQAKIDAGAEWLQVQGSFEPDRAVAFFDVLAAEGIPEQTRLVATIVPFSSRARLETLDRVPGISIPGCAWSRMRARDDADEGFDFALEVGSALSAHPAVSGLHIRPFGWEGVVGPLARALRAPALVGA